jgi:hypothetical protein
VTLNPTVTAVTTVGAGTLTAAALLSANILRSGPTGAFADSFDTAANIIAAVGVPSGSFDVTYVNNTAYVATLTASTGVTLAGASAAIPANSAAALLVVLSPAGTVTITVLYRSSVT